MIPPKIKSKYRGLLFPEIVSNVLTGYNIYRERHKTTAQFSINYLHSQLGLNSKGRPAPHRKALLDGLSQFADVRPVEFVVNSVIGRAAAYRLESGTKFMTELQPTGMQPIFAGSERTSCRHLRGQL